jgi:1-acyl-sn-glycerol-3-phosphate acyltransferase
VLKFFDITVQTHGLENIPKDRGVLFLFNHQSHFDIPCIFGSIPKRVAFGAKIELFKIPFFGAAMRVVGTLPIVRDNRAEVFRVYREAQERFAQNWNFALAPEGTRQSRPEIGNFKRGPFVFAVNAQAPIVPVVIAGAYEVLPKGRILPNADKWRRTVHLRFLPLIETTGLSTQDVSRLTDSVHEQFVAAFSEMKPWPT